MRIMIGVCDCLWLCMRSRLGELPDQPCGPEPITSETPTSLQARAQKCATASAHVLRLRSDASKLRALRHATHPLPAEPNAAHFQNTTYHR